MRACGKIAGWALIFLTTLAVGQKSEFDWDWRNQEVIGREDPSVGNTSKLTEPERSALIDAIVLRLQKPMGDAGYDDDRIREIATTSRIRFIDVGGGAPLIFTTSIGLEGGCDALGNCPLWIFRHTDDGFLSLLNTIAASYTPKRPDGAFEVVFMHHVSAKESGLVVYRLAGDKLEGSGCYTALWPKQSSDPNQMSDPKLEPCKQPPLLESAHPVKPDASESQAPAAAQQPSPSGQPEAQPKPDTAEPKEQAAPATEQPATQPAPESKEPKEQAPATDAPKAAQDQSEQQLPGTTQENQKAEPQPPSDQSAPGENQGVPKPDQPQQQPPAQPAPDGNQPPSDARQTQPPQETPPPNPEPAPPQASPQEPAPGQASPDPQQVPPSSPNQPQPNPNW
jgi:hypothetical protein